MMRSLFQRLALASLVLLAAAPAAWADADSIVTAGIGTGVTYSSGPGTAAGSATSFQVGSRLKFLYFLGIDMLVAPTGGQYDTGLQPPSLRLSAMLYLLNLHSFSLFGSVGTAGNSFSDLVDFEGATTHYRAGGGMEITIDGHYSLDLEGHWLVPGAGMVADRVESAFLETGKIMTMDEAVQTDGYELFFGLRYFL